MTWMDDARCQQADVDPEWWTSAPELAVHICRQHCDVRAWCDAWASGQPWSGLVVGGWLRPDGHGVRAQKQPQAKRAGCPTCAPDVLPRAPKEKAGPKVVGASDCPRCGKRVALFAGGRLAAHNSGLNWRCE